MYPLKHARRSSNMVNFRVIPNLKVTDHMLASVPVEDMENMKMPEIKM